jgi:hypothetical protein
MRMDFARYAGQCRPLTARDAVVILAIEQGTDAELVRATARAHARRRCDCEVCGDPTHPGAPTPTCEDEDEDET